MSRQVTPHYIVLGDVEGRKRLVVTIEGECWHLWLTDQQFKRLHADVVREAYDDQFSPQRVR